MNLLPILPVSYVESAFYAVLGLLSCVLGYCMAVPKVVIRVGSIFGLCCLDFDCEKIFFASQK